MAAFGRHQKRNAAFIKMGNEAIRLMQEDNMTEQDFLAKMRSCVRINHPDKESIVSEDDKKFKGKLNQYIPGLCEVDKLTHWDFVWTKLPQQKKYYPPEEIRELYIEGFISNPIYCDRVAKQKPTIWTTDIIKKIRQTNGDDGGVEKLLDNLEGMIK